jgi:hypothetical protein
LEPERRGHSYLEVMAQSGPEVLRESESMTYGVDKLGGKAMERASVASFALKTARSEYVTQDYASKSVKAITAAAKGATAKAPARKGESTGKKR